MLSLVDRFPALASVCRGTYVKLLLLLCVLAGGTTATAQPVPLLHPTNTTWRYLNAVTDPGFGTDWKDPLFGDDTWSEGRGLFGTETANYGFPINTAIPPTSGGGGFDNFFRVHFNWSSSTQGVLLIFTNYIDDGMAIFLNGIEIHRFNLNGNPGDPVQWAGAATSPTANPGGEPVRNIVTIDPTAPASGIPATLNQGDNVLAVYVGQAGGNSSDIVFGMDLRASQAVAPTVQHPPPGGTNITVLECRSLTMTVQASGIPAPTYQWNFQGGPITGATGPSYTIATPRPGDGGAYTVDVINSAATVTSPAFNVTVTEDLEGPIMLSATVNPLRTEVVVHYNEPLDTPGDGDQFLFAIEPVEGGSAINSFAPFGAGNLINGTDLIIPIDPSNPWVEGTRYRVVDTQGGGTRDACKQNPQAAQSINVLVPLVFRDGLNGYTGTEDVELRSAEPDNTALGTSATDFQVDNDPISHTLIQFRNIFGPDPNQVPVGAMIQSATLTFNQTDAGSAANAYRMLVDWNESATYNSMVNGIQNNGTEAEAAVAFDIPNAANAQRTFNVASSLSMWATNPAANHGWVLISTGTDGLRGSVSENATELNRPTLTVTFSVTPSPVGIVTQPPATININERDPLNISLVVTGSNLRFRWQKQIGGTFTDIPGANGGTYSVASAVPNDSGSYRVIITNEFNAVTSATSVVSVLPDTTRPTVTLTGVSENNTTLTLLFSEPVTSATANNTANYSIIPNVGISSATLGADSRTATIETGLRTFRTSYTLNISGIADTAVAVNTINTTNITFEQDRLIIFSYADSWKHELANQDGAAWTNADVMVYDDALWASGDGAFGLEPSGNGVATLANAGITIQTPWTVGTEQITYYLRKRFTVPAIPLDNVIFEMQHYIDDGAIAYVNGLEAWRRGFDNTNVTFASTSAGAPGSGTECTLLTNSIPLVAGENLIAVEVHQNSTTSSDVVFAARVLAVHRLAPPTLTITQSGANVTVSWTPAVGQLEESADLVNWSNSSRANGLPAPPSGGQMFYRVRQ